MNEEPPNIKNKYSSPVSNSLQWVPILHQPKMSFRAPKIQLPHKAPHQYIIAILVIATVFLLAGGIYDISIPTLTLGYTQQGYQPIYPGINSQFIVESFSIAIFILLGTVGLFLVKQAASSAQEFKPVNFMLTIGFGFLILSLIAAVMMIVIKVGPNFL